MTLTSSIEEELVNKQKRGRLWDIYLGNTWDTKDRLTRAETIRIRHIEKQLETIKRNHHLRNDVLIEEENCSAISRRSSLETRSIEHLENLDDRSKNSPQIQSNFRRLIVRRSLKKFPRTLSS